MSGSDQPSPSPRSLGEVSEEELVRLSLDLVAAARQNIGFLRDVAESHWLHHTPVLVESIRRYVVNKYVHHKPLICGCF